MSILLNLENNDWETGKNSLILGQRLGLVDSINTYHPRLFDLYKKQKSIDWDETEVSLIESRMDMKRAPSALIGIMDKNLSYQWEVDSVASRSFATLLAPFITNSEFWLAQSKNQEIEGLHALTYSEIVRQCYSDPKVIFKNILENKNIENRSASFIAVLEDLHIAGAQYSLGLVKNDQQLFNRVFLGLIAMYFLERLQFMSSFATTFISAEQGYFIGICKLVQKIAMDELTCHAAVIDYVLRDLIKNDPRAQIAMTDCHAQIKAISQDSTNSEYTWNRYIFQDHKRGIVGLTPDLLDNWSDYNRWFADNTIQLSSGPVPANPLKYMDNWLTIDAQQNANQEGDNTNYIKISTKKDVSDDVMDFSL